MLDPQRCSISLYFQNIIKKKKNQSSLWIGRCLLHKFCFFRRHQTMSPLWSSQSPVQGGSSVQAGSSLCSEDQPLSLSELLSIIRWPQMFNRQKPRPKYWETLICTFMQWTQLPHFFIWLLPIICPFLYLFFTGSQSDLVINFSSPFPWFPVGHFPVNPSLYFDETSVGFLLFPEFCWVLLAFLNNSVVV